MAESTAKQRVEQELTELSEKLLKLDNFTYTDKFKSMSNEQQMLLNTQEDVMQAYEKILKRRIEIWE